MSVNAKIHAGPQPAPQTREQLQLWSEFYDHFSHSLFQLQSAQV